MSDSSLPAATPWLSRPLIVAIAFVLACLGALTWLNLKAGGVGPEQHFAYTQRLRDLRELDTRIERELLANRQELERNYDALSDYLERTLDTSNRLMQPPAFLREEDRLRVREVAQRLRRVLNSKGELIDRFKRNHSVLRNSLAYFPVAAADMLDGENGRNLPQELRGQIGHYVRHVLAFARAPSDEGRAQATEAKALIRFDGLSGRQQQAVANLLLHGELITSRLIDLDRLTREAFSLQSEALLDTLERAYAGGHARALEQAGRYRGALYVIAALLAAFLAGAFARLERTRRSLTAAHAELSARHASLLAAEKQLELHATAFRSAHDGITLTDAEGNILDVNPAFTRITGYERDEVIGRNPRMLKSGRHDRAFYAAMWKSILETGSWRGEIWNRNKYGEIYPELLSISAVRDESGRITNYVAVFADISRLKAQEKQLTQMAYYDALTELPNRVLLADRLEQGILQTRRSQTLMAVCYLDLDGFKAINDAWGHDAGDHLLIEMAKRLRAMLRGGDTVARLGGDEFVLLLLGLANVEECNLAMERLLAAILQPFVIDDQPQTLSASIGVALFPQDDSDAETLLRHADQAMYQAKQSGKNRYLIFDVERDYSVRTRQNRIAELRAALDRGEFVLHYQPKVDMRQGAIIGAEALIRWNHPQRGLAPPIEFLPIIENDDLIRELGEWVIETALTQMERWQAAGLVLPVSVNVAGRHLQHHDFVEHLKQALARHPAVARRLELEVLETTAIEDVAKVSRIIEECHELGVGFSLDDFGTGYSSLTYLKRLPTRTIKIDQSFVREILSDTNNLVIVQGVIGLARAFQREVIAEGVETAEHGRLLLQLGCDLAQGYGIARPMPADALPAWMEQWRPAAAWQAIRDLDWDSNDHSLLVAEVEHRNWVAQLVFTTNELRPPPHRGMGDFRECRFGRWYYGAAQAKKHYTDAPAFARIADPHRRVHEVAADIDRLWREGRIELARSRIPDLLEARDEVIRALQDLQLSVAVRR